MSTPPTFGSMPTVAHLLIRTAAAFLFLLSLPFRASAQTDQTSNNVLASAGAFVLGTAMSVYTHELGHLTFDHLMGASSAQISFWPPRTSAKFPVDASRFDRTFPALAGPLTTRLLSEGVDCYLNNVSSSHWLNTVGGGWYLAMRFDLPWQVLISTVSYANNSRQQDDLYQGLIEPWFGSRNSRSIAYALLLISQIADIYLDADEITNNYHRLIGKKIQAESGSAGTIRFLHDPVSKRISISFTKRF